MNQQAHWDQVYATKQPEEVSWTQTYPQTSLELLRQFQLPKTASIIDIGGGDSRLVDFLLLEGYEDITVLDISEVALQKARLRLGEKANRVTWVVSDVLHFRPDRHYDLWHDRAAFHFLTTTSEVRQYLDIAGQAIDGYFVVGTFSDQGPQKCSGLPVKQYTETALQLQLQAGFRKIKCLTEDHVTPFGTRQNFLFCSFEKSQRAMASC